MRAAGGAARRLGGTARRLVPRAEALDDLAARHLESSLRTRPDLTPERGSCSPRHGSEHGTSRLGNL
jgi:hypothetical protein